jgi:hypothetical protein
MLRPRLASWRTTELFAGLDFGVVGRECRLSDGGIPYNPSPYNKEAYNMPTQSEQV